jgi:hypothetical protein
MTDHTWLAVGILCAGLILVVAGVHMLRSVNPPGSGAVAIREVQ